MKLFPSSNLEFLQISYFSQIHVESVKWWLCKGPVIYTCPPGPEGTTWVMKFFWAFFRVMKYFWAFFRVMRFFEPFFWVMKFLGTFFRVTKFFYDIFRVTNFFLLNRGENLHCHFRENDAFLLYNMYESWIGTCMNTFHFIYFYGV